jgi:transposase
METEPEKAADALDNIAKISRESLDEVRSVVAVLREDEPSYQPAPGLLAAVCLPAPPATVDFW